MNEIQNGLYEHYKGKRYEVLNVARHTETGEVLVIYKALYKGDFPDGTWWTRPLSMFQENVSTDGTLVPRFRFLSNQL